MAAGVPWKLVFIKNFISLSEAVKLEMIIMKIGAERFLSDIKNC